MGVPIAMPQSSIDPEYVPSVSGSDPTAPVMLPSAKSKKLSLERSDSRKYVYLNYALFEL